jgi:hypothetical protein
VSSWSTVLSIMSFPTWDSSIRFASLSSVNARTKLQSLGILLVSNFQLIDAVTFLNSEFRLPTIHAKELKPPLKVKRVNSLALFANQLVWQTDTEYLRLVTGCIVAKSRMVFSRRPTKSVITEKTDCSNLLTKNV